MHTADKAVVRLVTGVGLATLFAYGLKLTGAYLVVLMALALLVKPGPPTPIVKGIVMSFVVWGLLSAGVLIVPLLEHYALIGVAVVAFLLHAVYFVGARNPDAPTAVLVVAAALIPVIGYASQGLALAFALALALGLGIAMVVNGVSHAFFPDPPQPVASTAQAVPVDPQHARRIALQATVIIMPIVLLALTNPSMYVAAVIRTGVLAQQAGATDTRSAGRELLGSTMAGAGLALVVWMGLSMWPTLWMLILWLMAVTFWAGARLFQAKASALPWSFWRYSLITMLILLGPAIEDSANGQDVVQHSLVRISLFIVASLYAWATVWAFERWYTFRTRRLLPRAT